MAVVYIREQGAVVRKRGSRILVEKEHETLLEIPVRQTDSVAVFGNVQVTTQALSELLDRGIRTALDDAASLGIAKATVRAKILNGVALLADYRGHYPSDMLASACEAMRRIAGNAAGARDHGELLGYEGSAAAVYFGAFPEMNRSGLPFEGRRKHPATDPINGLLSLGYTLAMNEIRALVEGAGMDTTCRAGGWYHLCLGPGATGKPCEVFAARTQPPPRVPPGA